MIKLRFKKHTSRKTRKNKDVKKWIHNCEKVLNSREVKKEIADNFYDYLCYGWTVEEEEATNDMDRQ